MTICIAFPTIMSGLVLRWYASEEAYRRGDPEIANAGRESALVEGDCPLDVCKLADAAHDYLHAAYLGSFTPRLDVS